MENRPQDADEHDHGTGQPPGRLSLDLPLVVMQADSLARAPVLIVDDEAVNIQLVTAILSGAGFTNLHGTTDPLDALTLVSSLQPSLLLLDLHMPVLDGFTLMQRLPALIGGDGYLPVLVLTADTTPESRRRALAAGASDVLIKPFDATEVRLRVSNLLRTHALYAALQRTNASLEQQVRDRTDELERSRMETLSALALAAEFRDDDTGRHTQRVGHLSAMIAQTLALPSEQVELLRRAAPLHDIGKIGIPDHILLKPGRFTNEEFAGMQRHTTIGFDILAPCRSAMLQLARSIALTHHERWDGTGYPGGLAGDRIPLEGCIVAAADTFDAMTHDRPYQSARSVEAALTEIQSAAGRQFDPVVADALVRTVSMNNDESWT